MDLSVLIGARTCIVFTILIWELIFLFFQIRNVVMFRSTSTIDIWMLIWLKFFVSNINVDAKRVYFIFILFHSPKCFCYRLPYSLFLRSISRSVRIPRILVRSIVDVWTALVLLFGIKHTWTVRLWHFSTWPWLRRFKNRILFCNRIHVTLRELSTLLLKKHFHPFELKKLILGLILDHQLVPSYQPLRLSLNLIADFSTFINNFETVSLVELHRSVTILHDV